MNSVLSEKSRDSIERIYREWDDALSRKDVEALLAFYAPDATLESPLVAHLLHREKGICHGHSELRELFEILARTQPRTRRFYRTGYFTDGKKVMWEYPRKTPRAIKWISWKLWKLRTA
jgi:hypothetical protein